MSIKSAIQQKLSRIQSVNPDTKESNHAHFLADIYFYTQMAKYAESKVKDTYKTLQSEGFLKSDDEIREAAEGEKVQMRSPSFALVTKVADPRQSFDKDMFIERVATELHVSKLKMHKIAKECVKLSKAPLTKSVIESKL